MKRIMLFVLSMITISVLSGVSQAQQDQAFLLGIMAEKIGQLDQRIKVLEETHAAEVKFEPMFTKHTTTYLSLLGNHIIQLGAALHSFTTLHSSSDCMPSDDFKTLQSYLEDSADELKAVRKKLGSLFSNEKWDTPMLAEEWYLDTYFSLANVCK